jgi:hypothetical protein
MAKPTENPADPPSAPTPTPAVSVAPGAPGSAPPRKLRRRKKSAKTTTSPLPTSSSTPLPTASLVPVVASPGLISSPSPPTAPAEVASTGNAADLAEDHAPATGTPSTRDSHTHRRRRRSVKSTPVQVSASSSLTPLPGSASAASTSRSLPRRRRPRAAVALSHVHLDNQRVTELLFSQVNDGLTAAHLRLLGPADAARLAHYLWISLWGFLVGSALIIAEVFVGLRNLLDASTVLFFLFVTLEYGLMFKSLKTADYPPLAQLPASRSAARTGRSPHHRPRSAHTSATANSVAPAGVPRVTQIIPSVAPLDSATLSTPSPTRSVQSVQSVQPVQSIPPPSVAAPGDDSSVAVSVASHSSVRRRHRRVAFAPPPPPRRYDTVSYSQLRAHEPRR